MAAGSQLDQPAAKEIVVGNGGAEQRLLISPGTYMPPTTTHRHAPTSLTVAGQITIAAQGEISVTAMNDAGSNLASGTAIVNNGLLETGGGNAQQAVSLESGTGDLVNNKTMNLGAASNIVGAKSLTTRGTLRVSGDLELKGKTDFQVSGTVINGKSITVQTGTVTQSGGEIAGNAVALVGPNGGGIVGTGHGTGDFQIRTASKLSGTVAPGQLISVTSTPGAPASENLLGEVTNEGTIGLACPAGVTAQVFTESSDANSLIGET